MKNFVLITLLSFFIFTPFFVSLAALEAGKVPIATDFVHQGSPITEPNQFLDVIASVVKWTYAIFFIITVMFVLFAAFNYLTGGDEAEKIKSAHQQIMYAAIAVAIALLAVGFSFIIQRFLGQSDKAPTIQPAASPTPLQKKFEEFGKKHPEVNFPVP
jgi:heme/copper-type cytochrome/quinol oxidase subunit 2